MPLTVAQIVMQQLQLEAIRRREGVRTRSEILHEIFTSSPRRPALLVNALKGPCMHACKPPDGAGTHLHDFKMSCAQVHEDRQGITPANPAAGHAPTHVTSRPAPAGAPSSSGSQAARPGVAASQRAPSGGDTRYQLTVAERAKAAALAGARKLPRHVHKSLLGVDISCMPAMSWVFRMWAAGDQAGWPVLAGSRGQEGRCGRQEAQLAGRAAREERARQPAQPEGADRRLGYHAHQGCDAFSV
jgi:hypothetical protein